MGSYDRDIAPGVQWEVQLQKPSVDPSGKSGNCHMREFFTTMPTQWNLSSFSTFPFKKKVKLLPIHSHSPPCKYCFTKSCYINAIMAAGLLKLGQSSFPVL